MRDTWGAPTSGGWPKFDENGRRVYPCPFCTKFAGGTDDELADHIRDDCNGMKK